MAKPKITAHVVIKNEQFWIWYALQSVLDYLDEIVVFDTGSTDTTTDIIKSISSPKIKLHVTSSIDPDSFTNLRQQMLDETKSDWLTILDGDEIWPYEAINRTIAFIQSAAGRGLDYLVHPYYNLLGDVYHYQESGGGNYTLDGRAGHLTIRFINLSRLPKLHYARPYGQEGLFDDQNTPLQDRTPRNYHFMHNCHYLHTTNLRRSPKDTDVMKRSFKFKYEIGLHLPDTFTYPVSFYIPHSSDIASPWQPASLSYWLNSSWQTPLKYLKRRLHTPSSGY